MTQYTTREPAEHPAPGHLCLASSLILSERPMPIRFFYRDTPDHGNDSGFRFYSGLETDEFLMRDGSALVAPLDCMERIDPSISRLLERSAVGSVWERRPGSNDWIPVTDYRIPA